jgi:hypothetical protein
MAEIEKGRSAVDLGEINLVDGAATGHKVARCIYMRAGVSSQDEFTRFAIFDTVSSELGNFHGGMPMTRKSLHPFMKRHR